MNMATEDEGCGSGSSNDDFIRMPKLRPRISEGLDSMYTWSTVSTSGRFSIATKNRNITSKPTILQPPTFCTDHNPRPRQIMGEGLATITRVKRGKLDALCHNQGHAISDYNNHNENDNLNYNHTSDKNNDHQNKNSRTNNHDLDQFPRINAMKKDITTKIPTDITAAAAAAAALDVHLDVDVDENDADCEDNHHPKKRAYGPIHNNINNNTRNKWPYDQHHTDDGHDIDQTNASESDEAYDRTPAPLIRYSDEDEQQQQQQQGTDEEQASIYSTSKHPHHHHHYRHHHLRRNSNSALFRMYQEFDPFQVPSFRNNCASNTSNHRNTGKSSSFRSQGSISRASSSSSSCSSCLSGRSINSTITKQFSARSQYSASFRQTNSTIKRTKSIKRELSTIRREGSTQSIQQHQKEQQRQQHHSNHPQNEQPVFQELEGEKESSSNPHSQQNRDGIHFNKQKYTRKLSRRRRTISHIPVRSSFSSTSASSTSTSVSSSYKSYFDERGRAAVAVSSEEEDQTEATPYIHQPPTTNYRLRKAARRTMPSQQPGAYSAGGRAFGERPAWASNSATGSSIEDDGDITLSSSEEGFGRSYEMSYRNNSNDDSNNNYQQRSLEGSSLIGRNRPFSVEGRFSYSSGTEQDFHFSIASGDPLDSLDIENSTQMETASVHSHTPIVDSFGPVDELVGTPHNHHGLLLGPQQGQELKKSILLRVVVFIGIIIVVGLAVAISVVVWIKARKYRANLTATQDCIEYQLPNGQVDIRAQCKCQGLISKYLEETEQKYESLKELLGTLSPVSTSITTEPQLDKSSCQPRNIALWNAATRDRWDDMDRYVLEVLYFSLDGDNWLSAHLWLSDHPTCDWAGIECMANEITEIDLSKNLLHGEIPGELGLLIHLEYINLMANQLTGSIPNEIGLLQNLRRIEISLCELTGTLPTELGAMTSLEIVDVSLNSIKGTIPTEIGNLINLNFLVLHDNLLSGHLPKEIENLNQISLFYIANNLLTSSIPSEIGMMTYVDELLMSDNLFEAGPMPTELYGLTKLNRLEIDNIKIQGSLPQDLSKLTLLEIFYATSNSLTGTLPTEIGLMTSLTSLDIESNFLNGSIPSEIGLLVDLTALALGGNAFGGELPSEINNLSNLVRLSLGPRNRGISGSLAKLCGIVQLIGAELLDSTQLDCPCCTEH